MTYFRFPHISELSFTRRRRRAAFRPSPLNHTETSESFIIVTIISISLTHKSCHKSTHISFCDNMHDQWWEVLQFCSYSTLSRSLAGLSRLKGFMNQQAHAHTHVCNTENIKYRFYWFCSFIFQVACKRHIPLSPLHNKAHAEQSFRWKPPQAAAGGSGSWQG